MNKYRIKLKNDRVVGPFIKLQVAELYLKGHIQGDEECQLFPGGEWLTIKEFEELGNIIEEIISKKITLDDLKKEIESKTLVNLAVLGEDKRRRRR